MGHYLKSPFDQLVAYDEYISDKSRFGTHQGIKGLEFPKVMVILDDDEAGGFLFSYEKLLGAKELSDTDKKMRMREMIQHLIELDGFFMALLKNEWVNYNLLNLKTTPTVFL